MRIRSIVLFIWITAIFLGSCSGQGRLISKNQERAKPIIDALLEYERIHGTFPTRMQGLVPRFIDSIPLTISGEDYFYSTNSVDGFVLSFTVKPRFGCGYTYQAKEWECGYGD